MKKTMLGVVLGLLLGVSGMALYGQNERAMHPRIAAAIKELQEANAYMAAAPHDFGGHKAAAMRACTDAIAQLRLALAYRGAQDRR